MTEDEMVGWYHQLDGHEFEQAPGVDDGEGNSNPLQYSCLENPMNREGWRATVHSVAKSWT